MDIRIDRNSEIPIRRQLAEHIVFCIATEKLKPGEALPSVRALARQLKIHYNTVSEAYQDLVNRTWLVGRRGRRLIVRGPENDARPAKGRGAGPLDDLDDLINATIRAARQQGHSLQELRERVRKRLLAEPPDHLLVVEDEPGLRSLLVAELGAATGEQVDGCSLAELAGRPELAIGALTVAGHFSIGQVDPLVPKNIPAIPLTFSAADEHVEMLRKLVQPSVIAVVSVSAAFLKTARSVLAPALGRRHEVLDFEFPMRDAKRVRGADLVFADAVAHPRIKHAKLFRYRVIAPGSLEYVATAMKSYRAR